MVIYRHIRGIVWTVKYKNTSINTNLFCVDFTKTQIQKVPLPHLTRTMTFILSKYKYDNRLFLTCKSKIWLTQFFPRTKSSVNQGVGVIDFWWPPNNEVENSALCSSWPWPKKRRHLHPFVLLLMPHATQRVKFAKNVHKMKSDFHTENKKSCLGSKLNFVFYTCLPHFTLGLTILVDIRKVRQVCSDFTEMLE